jgi:hypothetical protein
MEVKDGDAKPATGEAGQETPPAEGADKGDKPDRKNWIPREQFDQLVATVGELANAVKDGARQAAKPPEAPKVEKVLSRMDLRAAVEAQQLTQEEADSIWDKQMLEQARKVAREEASQTLSVKQTTQRVDEDLRRYRAAVPNAWKEGTEERAKLADEYRYLVSIGQPDTKETELAAMRSTFGPVDKLGKARSTTVVDTDESTAGGGGEDTPTKKDPVKGLDARQRAHYQKGIEQGRYKGWDAVREELGFKRR